MPGRVAVLPFSIIAMFFCGGLFSNLGLPAFFVPTYAGVSFESE